jgi:hypothetical protein
MEPIVRRTKKMAKKSHLNTGKDGSTSREDDSCGTSK